MFNNKQWTLMALYHHLKDTKLVRKSENYALQITERVGSNRKVLRAVSVVCLLCSACLSVNNIPWAQTQHNSCAACVGRHASTSATPPPPSSAQSPAVLAEAKQEFSLFLYTSGTPFARADNPHLKRMFQLLGVHDSPTAKQMRTSYLSSSCSRLKKKVTAVVEQLLLVQQIAKTLGDCHKISSALDIAQLEVYGELRGDALRNMRERGDWAKVSAGSANHACFDVVLDIEWWKRLDAVISLMQPIFNAIQQLEANRPLLSQVMEDLTAEQQQDVKLVVARLAEAASDAAAEELDNFEMGAWDPDMTRGANIILRMTKATELNGRTVIVIAPAHQRLTWWQVYAQSKFPILAKAAMWLLSVHVSTCAAERNWSAWGRTFADAHRNNLSIQKAEELVFIQANDELTYCNQRDLEKELAIELF
ncbi:hypothetical protein QJQ45_005449 [Haematococcus lacustris]|nr:hypothetical protein QJQ45_005449 [Haematococcus lacustris]